MKVFMIGGAGAMAWGTARELVDKDSLKELTLADLDPVRIRNRVTALNDPRVTGITCDATDIPSLVRGLQGCDICANAANNFVNLDVMKACLEAGVHYVDLGGLFHITRKQLLLDKDFKDRGLVALLGMGAGPGVVNVVAGWCGKDMETVDKVKIQVASLKSSENGQQDEIFIPPYSIVAIMDEFTVPCPILSDGEFKNMPAGSGKEQVVFPEPIGNQAVVYCIHSEPATLTKYFRNKGISECSFQIALPETFLSMMKLLISAGFGIRDKIKIGRESIIPSEFLNLVIQKNIERNFGKIKKRAEPPSEAWRTHLAGTRSGKRIEIINDVIFIPEKDKWKGVVHPGTSIALSIGIEMIYEGQVNNGAGGPESIIKDFDFFMECLKKKGLKISRTERKL